MLVGEIIQGEVDATLCYSWVDVGDQKWAKMSDELTHQI